jgi:superfamily I DNA/RNA helicase
LCRRNFDLDRIASELKAADIPICVVGGKGFYKTQEVIDTYKLLAAIIYNSETAMNEVRFTDYSRSTTHERISHLIVEMQDVIRIETMVTALTQLYERSGILNYYRSHRKYQAASNLLKLSELAQTLTSRDNMQPIQFLEYLRIMISTNQEEDEAEIPERERMGGVVSLYSIHKAKGLSFPIVVIPCCDNKLNRPITKPKIILDLGYHL